VAQGIGQRGTAVDYIRNTLAHMHELGVGDPHLERILHAALLLRTNGSGAAARAEVPAPQRQPEATAARDVLPRRASSGRAPRRGARAASRS
jgi:hypothetical protein